MQHKVTPWENFVNMAKVIAKKNGQPMYVIKDGGQPHVRRAHSEDFVAINTPPLKAGEFYINERGESFEITPTGERIKTEFYKTTVAFHPPL